MMDRDFKGVWIPKEIWLSKDLSVQEKVLLVEINSLSKTENGCFASNEYFADFIGLSKERTRKLISSLVDKGYITSSIEYKKGTREVDKRWLKATIPYGRFQPYPLVENDQDINTELLIQEKKEISKDISKEKKRFTPPTISEVEAYIKEKGYHFNAKAFFDYYASANWHKSDGKAVKNWKQCCALWESNRKDDTPQKTVNDDRRKRLE